MITYKALLHESMAIKVDAHYSSQACPGCGHTSPLNRPNKGLLFVCQHCRYTLHADLVGARNVNHVHQMCFCACLIIAYLYTPLGMVSHRLSLSCFAPFHERQWERWASCRNKRASLDLFACLLKELGPLLDVGSHQRSFFTAHWGYLAHDPVYDLLQLCLVFVQFPLQDDQRQRWRWF